MRFLWLQTRKAPARQSIRAVDLIDEDLIVDGRTQGLLEPIKQLMQRFTDATR